MQHISEKRLGNIPLCIFGDIIKTHIVRFDILTINIKRRHEAEALWLLCQLKA